MHRPGFDVDRLQGSDAGHRRHDLGRREVSSPSDNRGWPYGLGDRIDAADAAACGTRDMAPPFVDKLCLGGRKPHPQFDAVVEIDDIERSDILSRLYDALAEAESDREIP